MTDVSNRGIRASAEFPVVEHAGRFQFYVRGLNISTSGCLVNRGDLPLREDHVVELEIHLPERETPMRVLASTVWTKGSLEGLKFLGLNDADRLTLAEGLDSISAQGGDLE